MRQPRRLTYWTLGLVPGLVTVILGASLVWLRGSLPDLDGNHVLPGLAAPAEVLRDADGVVTIHAEGELDAARALGYVHAQDRLWQMDFMRRAGAGRLSEVVGPATLRIDRLMRGLGLYRTAENNLAELAPDVRALLEAYAEGVNAFLAAPRGPWPPEFQLLRYEPEPWRPADSLVWGRLMAFQLSGNWPDESLRLYLSGRLSPAQIDVLWPEYPPDAPVTLTPTTGVRRASKASPLQPYDERAESIATKPRLNRDSASAPRGIDPELPWSWAPKDASNLWVLDGARTATGRPILANDPHLPLEAPGQWYLTRIETPELTLSGATAPGVPYLVVGHNGHIAWGFTTTHADTQDLFMERLSTERPGHYDTPDGPRPFEVREEVIEVRHEAPEVLTVRTTRHGPVFSDLRPALAKALPEDQVLALAWPALNADDRTAEAVYRLNRARGWPDFLAAMALFHSPAQNVAYADTAGAIGFHTVGRIPLRKAGDGRAPVPGWTGAHDWRGFIPFAELPRVANPPGGRIVNANNRVADGTYPHLITADWPDPHRARRITLVLNAHDKITVENSLALQQDTVSLGARRLLLQLLHYPLPESKQVARAGALLAKWDYRMARDQPAPLIFHAWLAELNKALLADDLGPVYSRFQRVDSDLLVAVLSAGDVWCDDVRTPKTESCAGLVGPALEAALARLEERFGADIDDWRWGKAHIARFPHPVLRHIPVIGSWLEFAVEADGGFYTVNRGGPRLGGAAESRFEDHHGPGFRAVYDLADLDNSRFMIATGQSGNPLSAHYGSLARRWRDGDYLKLDGASAEPRYRLRLDPG
jgi:penicillin amidase